jgi:hypothetical protein
MRLSALAASAGVILLAAGTYAAQEAPAVECVVAKTESGNGIGLVGQVRSKTGLSGTYQFEVKQQGTAGTSNIMQSGEFTAKPNQLTELSSAQINAGKAQFTARLIISWAGGKEECTVGSGTQAAQTSHRPVAQI